MNLQLYLTRWKLNTNEILNAANTKWNFLDFKPGLVGGHCIGIDPYYLAFQSKNYGYDPELILSARKTNDSIPAMISKKAIDKTKINFDIKKINFLVMGITFKENCLDFRNSKVFEIISLIKKKGHLVDLYDPVVNSSNLEKEHKIKNLLKMKKNFYHCIIIAVAHSKFKKMGIMNIRKSLKKNGIVFDVKNLFNGTMTEIAL